MKQQFQPPQQRRPVKPTLSKTTSTSPKPRVNNNSPPARILRVDPAKAEKYRREGELRIKEQVLEEEKRRMELKREKNRLKKERKKAAKAEEPWYSQALSAVGSAAKTVLPLLVGMGDYATEDGILKTADPPETNSLLAAQSAGKYGSYGVPFMHSEKHCVKVTHREYLGDIYSTTSSFVTEQFDINPGLDTSFPWLSGIASRFTGYRMKGAVVQFVSEGSEYTNSAGLGYVALAAQYNADDPAFTNKKDMLNSLFSNAAKPSKSIPMWIECKPQAIVLDSHFVRSGTLPAEKDLNLYDLCRVSIAAGGNTVSDVIVGELWITYDVEFVLPTLQNRYDSTMFYARYKAEGVTNALTSMGTSWSRAADSTRDLTISKVGNVVSLVLPKRTPNKLKITIRWTFAGSFVALTAPTHTQIHGTLVPDWDGVSNVASAAGGVSVAQGFNFEPPSDNTPGQIDFDTTSCTTYSGATQFWFEVIQVPESKLIPPNSSIFDKLGLGRQEKYSAFMEKIIPQIKAMEEPLVLRETLSFRLLSVGAELYLVNCATQRKISAPGFEKLAYTPDDVWDNLARAKFAEHGSS
jgi:hypothetical protein